MSKKANELRTQKATLFEELQQCFPETGAMSPEQRKKHDEYIAQMKDLDETINRMESAEKTGLELRSTKAPPKAAVGDPTGEAVDKDEWKVRERQYRRAFWRAMKTHPANLTAIQTGAGNLGYNGTPLAVLSDELRSVLGKEEFRTAARAGKYAEFRDFDSDVGNTIGSPTASYPTSVLVPQGFVYDLEVATKYYGEMLNVATILETATGQPLPYPTENDTEITGEWIGEGQQVTANDLSVSNILFGAYKYSTKLVKVSLELLQDSAFDLETYIKDAFAIRIGRLLNTAFTKGGGTTVPWGIMEKATASGQVVIGDDNAVSPAIADPTTEVGYLDLVNLEHSVDRTYRKGAKFMFHDSTLQYLKTLKDKYGRPLWLQAISATAPETILGYPYSVNNDMDQLAQSSPASGRNTVAFGRLDKYIIRKVRDLAVLRLVERFADYGQVAFIGFGRVDGNLLDAGTHPVKYLTNPS